MSQFALRMAAYAARIYGTRNPFDIIEQRAINFKTTPRLVDTLGFYAVVNNRRFIRLSEYATEVEQLMAAGHELGHDFLTARKPGRTALCRTHGSTAFPQPDRNGALTFFQPN